MIFIDRSKIAAPAVLTDPDKAGVRETAAAIAHYVNGDAQRAFEYKVYRHPEVKTALIELFRGKCAYCESQFLHVYSGDVEHFRPKGEIEEAVPDRKPGYYWLAADWNNLLLSCRNCNQKLMHAVYGVTDRRVMGKMNQFPLANAWQHIRRHDDVHGVQYEEPHRLLLNPCVDDPEMHLEYGEEGVIKAKKMGDGRLSEKGVTSIKVYVLQRVPLVLARERWLIDMQAQMQRVKEAVINFNEHVNSQDTFRQMFFEKILKRELRRLKRFLDPEEQYVGMARQVVGGFLKENFGIEV